MTYTIKREVIEGYIPLSDKIEKQLDKEAIKQQIEENNKKAIKKIKRPFAERLVDEINSK